MNRVREAFRFNGNLLLPYSVGYTDEMQKKRSVACGRCKKKLELYFAMYFPSDLKKRRLLDAECFWKEMKMGTNDISVDLIYGIDQLKYCDQKDLLENIKQYKQLQEESKLPIGRKIFGITDEASLEASFNAPAQSSKVLILSKCILEHLLKDVRCGACNKKMLKSELTFQFGAKNMHISCVFRESHLIWGNIDMIFGIEECTAFSRQELKQEYMSKLKEIEEHGVRNPQNLTMYGRPAPKNLILVFSTILMTRWMDCQDKKNTMCPECKRLFLPNDFVFYLNNNFEHSHCAFSRTAQVFETPEDSFSWATLDESAKCEIKMQYVTSAKLASIKTMMFIRPNQNLSRQNRKRVSEDREELSSRLLSDKFTDLGTQINPLEQQLNQMDELRHKFTKLHIYDIRQFLKHNQQIVSCDNEEALEQFVDAATFGVPAPCSKCKGSVIYNVSRRCYTCTGYTSKYTFCNFSSPQTPRTTLKFPASKFGSEVQELLSVFSMLPTRLYVEGGSNNFATSIPNVPSELLLMEPGRNTRTIHEPIREHTYYIKQRSAVLSDYEMGKNAHVMRDEDTEHKYEAFLTFVEMQNNQNTIKHLVILEDDCEEKYDVVTFTSRVGTHYGNIKAEKFLNKKEAVNFFENEFYNLTGNCWMRRNDFNKKYAKFFYVETVAPPLDFALKTSRGKTELKVMREIAPQHYEALLETWTTNKTLSGQVSPKMQTLAMDKLQLLSELVENRVAKRHEVLDLTNTIYSIMPTCTGLRPEYLDTPDKVNLCMERLYEEAVFTNIPKIHPCDSLVDKLGAELKTLTDPFQLITIDTYHQNTQGRTHQVMTELKDIFEINRFGHPDHTFEGPRMLLWHGTSKDNLASILKQGLLIRPGGRFNGGMFGSGIYFADCFTKSFNYTRSTQSLKYLLLCEVYLGRSHESFVSLHQDEIEKGLNAKKYESVKGMGRYRPKANDVRDLDGVTVPCGALEDYFAANGEPKLDGLSKNYQSRCLDYNEYIVYDEKRVKLRYLVVVKHMEEERNRR